MIAGLLHARLPRSVGISPAQSICKNEAMGGNHRVPRGVRVGGIETLGFHSSARRVRRRGYLSSQHRRIPRAAVRGAPVAQSVHLLVRLSRAARLRDRRHLRVRVTNQLGGARSYKIRPCPMRRTSTWVIPIPDRAARPPGSCQRWGSSNREGFVKEPYIGRTFHQPGQAMRTEIVRHKLNPVGIESGQGGAARRRLDRARDYVARSRDDGSRGRG